MQTPTQKLFYAIECKDEFLVKKYLPEANLAVSINGRTPISCAGRLGNWNLVKYIATMRKTDSTDSFQFFQPLLRAVRHRVPGIPPEEAALLLDCIRALLNAGARKDAVYRNEECALHIAITNNDRKVVSLLLCEETARQKKHKTITPYQLAANLKHWALLELMVLQSRSFEKTQNRNNALGYEEALKAAVDANQTGPAVALLNWGTHIYQNCKSECLHLLLAKENPNEKLAILLLDHGASLSYLKDSKTPIQTAAKAGHWHLIKAIAATRKTNNNDTFRFGSALYDAVTHRKPDTPPNLSVLLLECIRTLLKAGSLQTDGLFYWERKSTGNSILHSAVVNEDVEVTALLLKFGADYTVWNNAKQTPQMINRKMYLKSWHIHALHQTLFLSGLPRLLLLGHLDEHSLFFIFTQEVLEKIFNLMIGGINLEPKNTILGAREKYKKISCQIAADNMTKCFGMFGIKQSMENRTLIKNLSQVKETEEIQDAVKDFLHTVHALGKQENEIATIKNLKKYGLTSDEELDKIQLLYAKSDNEENSDEKSQDSDLREWLTQA